MVHFGFFSSGYQKATLGMDQRPTSCPRRRGGPTEVIWLLKGSSAIGGRACLGGERRRDDGLGVRRGIGCGGVGLATLFRVENRGFEG